MYLAQKVSVGGQEITGPLENISTVGDLLNRIMQFLIPLSAVILFLVLVSGGYDYLLSRGNPDKIKSAKAKITAGVIGFVLLVSAYIITKVIATVFFGVGSAGPL